MNVFFDVDDTIVSSVYGTLRPLVRELFHQLQEEGHRIYIWSGVGLRWDVIERHQLRPFISGCFLKPLFDHHNRLTELGVTVKPDYCIDDYPEIAEAFGGITVRPYWQPDKQDREMERVYQAIYAAVNGGPFREPPRLPFGDGQRP